MAHERLADERRDTGFPGDLYWYDLPEDEPDPWDAPGDRDGWHDGRAVAA